MYSLQMNVRDREQGSHKAVSIDILTSTVISTSVTLSSVWL